MGELCVSCRPDVVFGIVDPQPGTPYGRPGLHRPRWTTLGAAPDGRLGLCARWAAEPYCPSLLRVLNTQGGATGTRGGLKATRSAVVANATHNRNLQEDTPKSSSRAGRCRA